MNTNYIQGGTKNVYPDLFLG